MKKPTDKFTNEIITILRFGLVGLANTALTASLMFLLDLTGMPYPVHTTIAYIAGIICSFLLNRWFTFKNGNDSQVTRLARFIILTLFLLGIAQITQFALIELAHFPKVFGIGIGMIMYTGLGYIGNRFWVFAIKEKSES